jgi:NAD(P)-dependent dehydrogenase (short-subunit alcohol dehydrogenase family)
VDVRDKVVVVTGSARGIGRALSERFAREGARGVVMADRDPSVEPAAQVAGGIPIVANVAHEPDVVRIVRTALDRFGRVDLFCSNAGVFFQGSETASDEEWDRIWRVNVMAHVYAA